MYDLSRTKKNIPNFITISRIVFAIMLLFVSKFGIFYYILYSLCGISDMLDGFIARKTDTKSNLGAILDSVADFVFVISVLITSFPKLVNKLPKATIILIAVIFIIKIISIIIGYCKYKKLIMLHTYMNKITGLLLFLIIYFINFNLFSMFAFIVAIFALVASVEELACNIKSKNLNLNIKGILDRKN